MSIKTAFDYLLNLNGRVVILTRPQDPTDLTVSVKMSQSVFERNQDGVENISIKRREYVVAKQALDAVGFPRPIRGDRIKDGDNGTHIIVEAREMNDMGGEIIGWRMRTG